MFRYQIEEYSKGSSKEYSVGIDFSFSMQFADEISHKVINKYFPEKQKLNILEIGGGHGDLALKLKKEGHRTHNITNNIDERDQLLNKGLDVSHTDMHNLYFENCKDLVICSHVFEHSFAPYALMTEFNEVLSENGIVVIIVPSQEERWVYEDYHYIVPTMDQLINLGSKCGFEKLLCYNETHKTVNHLIYVGKKTKNWRKK